MKLFTIIQKNFKVFIRSKVSAFIIFLGPLLLVSLVGLSFSSAQLPGLTVGTYSPDYNNFTTSIIQQIINNKLVISKYDSNESCSNAVKKGDVSICLVFPHDMDATNNVVTFIVDYSKMNLVWVVVDIFSNQVSDVATQLRYNYASDLVGKVIQTQQDLVTQKQGISDLGTQQSQATGTLTSAQSSLAKINPTTDLGQTSNYATAQNSLSSLQSSLQSAQSSLTTAQANVDGSSMSDTEKSTVDSNLQDISGDITNALVYVTGNSSTASLGLAISDMESAIQNAQLQLTSIKNQRDTVNGQLVTLNSALTNAANKIVDLQNSVEATSARLAAVQQSDTQKIVSPITTQIEPVTTEETNFNYLFPTLIVLVVMITAVLLGSTLVMTEKKSKSVFRNFVTPTSDVVFELGIFVTSFIAIAAQLVIFLFVSSFFFNTDVLSSILQSSLVLVLVISVFVLLGMLIGYLFKSEETYVLASITVSAILMFLSSTIMPIESISNSVRQFASVTPFVISENTLRQVMFFHFSIGSVISQLCILLGYALVFFGFIFVGHKLLRYNLTLKKKDKPNK